MSHMCPAKAAENQELTSAIWGLSGDIHILLTQRAAHLEIHREDFVHQREEDKAIWESARLELGSAGEWGKHEKHDLNMYLGYLSESVCFAWWQVFKCISHAFSFRPKCLVIQTLKGNQHTYST